MKQKVLISILGRGQYNGNLNQFDYKVTSYKIDDLKATESKLVSDILQKIIEPDITYIVGTNESLWNIADEYLDEYEKVIIPYGKSYEEFWNIFEILTKLDVENKEIYFDITHGFRSIPIFISTLLNFFSKVKNAQVKGVYYGIFEAKDENGVTPIINMLPFLEMNAFIEAFAIFKKYSDGRDIAEVIQKNFSQLTIEEKKKYNKLNSLAKELEFYSKSIGFSAVRFYQNSLNKLKVKVEQIDTVPKNLKAIKFLMEDLEYEFGKFDNLTRIWRKDFETSKLLFDRNRYAQALTILRETILTYIIEEVDLKEEIDNENIRENIIGKLIKEDSDLYRSKKNTKYFNENFIDLYGQIRDLRNKSNHAFIKKSVGDRDIKRSIEKLKYFIDEFENFSYKKRIIKNKQNLRSFLKS